jgi:hypothetical protein
MERLTFQMALFSGLRSNPTSGKKEKSGPQKQIQFMPHLVSGKSLAEVVVGSDQFQLVHDEDHDPRSIAAMKDILGLLQRDVVRLYDADPIERLNIESELSQELKGLEDHGYYLFGVKRIVPRVVGQGKVAMCTLFMNHARSPKIIRDKKANMMIPALLSEAAR